MTPLIDSFWKLMALLGMAITAILWGLKQQGNKTKSDSQTEANFKEVNKTIDEQEKHIEFQDTKIESFSDKLDKISQQINQFGVFDLRLKQLEVENNERKEENKIIMRKLDGIFNKMNQLEISMSNKANKA